MFSKYKIVKMMALVVQIEQELVIVLELTGWRMRNVNWHVTSVGNAKLLMWQAAWRMQHLGNEGLDNQTEVGQAGVRKGSGIT